MDFLAFDGEAIDDGYRLLACSNGKFTLSTEGELTTSECLSFLCDQVPRGSKTLNVCFGLNYDVNNWVRSLSQRELIQLWSTGQTHHRDWFIEWVGRRSFHCNNKVLQKKIALYDPLGFFQMKFVDACEAWGVKVDPSMTEMKALRGTFSAKDLDRTIKYCLEECEALVKLMDKLYQACVAADIVPKRWEGAGSVAAALLQREGIRNHHVYDSQLLQDPSPILCAYKGGRVECLSTGVYEHLQGADVISAYPSSILCLPTLDGASLTYTDKFDPGAYFAIWHVKWRHLPGRVMPFAVRFKETIWYPSSGEGYYHAAEVRAAREAFPNMIEIDHGYVLQYKRKVAPFAWINESFRMRAKLKAEGHPAEKVLKLGLNSLYGKMAQGIGGRKGKSQYQPPFQSYFWAGHVTAETRAKMFKAALLAKTPIMITTDGIYAQQIKVPNTDGLGGWEKTNYDEFFSVQAGVYSARDSNGREFYRSRGFRARDVDYQDIREGWETQGYGYQYRYKSKLFHGLGMCAVYGRSKPSPGDRPQSQLKRISDRWRQWLDVPRMIDLEPDRKNIIDGELWPITDNLGESEPYRPKTLGIDDTQAAADLVAYEQPDPG